MEIWDIYDCNRVKTGRTHERGKPMIAGDYHLVVFEQMKVNNSEVRIILNLRKQSSKPNLLM